MINYRLALKSELPELKAFLFRPWPKPMESPASRRALTMSLIWSAQEKASILVAIEGEQQMAGFGNLLSRLTVLPSQYLQYSNQQPSNLYCRSRGA